MVLTLIRIVYIAFCMLVLLPQWLLIEVYVDGNKVYKPSLLEYTLNANPFTFALGFFIWLAPPYLIMLWTEFASRW